MATKNELDSNYPIEVAAGGTGKSSVTAYAVLCGGTTTTNPIQSIAAVGTAGQVLTSNGAGALPTFQTASPSATAGLVHIETKQGSGADLNFTTGITLDYQNFMFFFSNVVLSSNGFFQFSEDGGGTYVNTEYYVDNHYRAFDSTTYNTASAGPTSALAWASPDTTFAITGCFWLYRGTFDASPFDPAMTGMFVSKRGGVLNLTQFMGYHNGNLDDIDAIKVGGVNTGTVSLYGLVFSF